MDNWKKTFGITIGFVLFLVISFIVSWKYFERRATEDVFGSRPDYFPIVINSPGKSELILLEDLDKYRNRYPDYSFLVPDEKAELINRQLQSDQQERRGKGVPKITATKIAEGKQLVEVEIIGDGLWDSKYEATDKDITPLKFTLSGPLFPMFPCATTMILGIVGFVLLQVLLWWSRKGLNLN